MVYMEGCNGLCGRDVMVYMEGCNDLYGGM